MIDGFRVGSALCKLGILPQNCRRAIIDIEHGKPVTIYAETLAGDRLASDAVLRLLGGADVFVGKRGRKAVQRGGD